MAQVDRDGLSFRAASMRGIGEREPGLVVVWEAEVRTGRRRGGRSWRSPTRSSSSICGYYPSVTKTRNGSRCWPADRRDGRIAPSSRGRSRRATRDRSTPPWTCPRRPGPRPSLEHGPRAASRRGSSRPGSHRSPRDTAGLSAEEARQRVVRVERDLALTVVLGGQLRERLTCLRATLTEEERVGDLEDLAGLRIEDPLLELRAPLRQGEERAVRVRGVVREPVVRDVLVVHARSTPHRAQDFRSRMSRVRIPSPAPTSRSTLGTTP